MLENGLFLFHRDFRIVDNNGLNSACNRCKKIYGCFIFTPEQATPQRNKYHSNNSVQFMIESLQDLQKEFLKHGGELLIFYGNEQLIVSQLIEKLHIDAVFFNKDYTPYALKRTEETVQLCEKKKITCHTFSDYYLFEPGTILSGQGTAYKKFTPFYEHAMTQTNHIDPVVQKKSFPFAKSHVSLSHTITLEKAAQMFTKSNPSILVHGGRTLGVKRLKHALISQSQYDKNRDFLSYETSFLSAYIKFGCISIREVYYSFAKKYGKRFGLIRELFWREFFASVLFHFPEVMGQSYQKKFRSLSWSHSATFLEKWKKGMTGFPIVDAGMRQLNTTGYMHNRVRMVTASFLIKVLLIDWRHGEQYFATMLTDYDIASNNGNWQGISGTGVDMKPYFRDMNPWIQSKKFDDQAEYIKKWIPELKEVLPSDIHKWNIMCHNEKYKDIQYPPPTVNYEEQKKKMLKMYEKAL